MRPLKILILFVITSIILSACSTGQNAFKKGDYYSATLQAVRNLRSNPNSEKSKLIIQQSYPMAIEYYRQRVDLELSSNSNDKYIKTVQYYTKLNALADEISRCPAALEVVKPVVYFNEQLRKAEQLALKEQYDGAIGYLNSTRIDEARQALKMLEWVRSKDPNYGNINAAMSKAEDLATMKVVVEDYPSIAKGYRINSRVFYTRLFTDLKQQAEKRFLRFYDPENAEKLSLTPHEIVTVQFIDFNIGTLLDRERTETFKSDSVKVGTYKDAAGIEHVVLGIVKAEVVTHERELLCRGVLQITIKDFETNRVIASQQFPGEYIWQNHWASYNGDEQAVPVEVKKLIKQKQLMPPTAQDMFLLFSDPIFFSAAGYLKNYYRSK